MTDANVRTFCQARMAMVLKTLPRWRMVLAFGFIIVVGIQVLYPMVEYLRIGLLIVAGGVLAGAIPAICPWFFRTLKYELGADGLTIIRAWPLSRIIVPYSGIASVTRSTLEHQYGSLEAGGNPMLTVSRSPFVRMTATDGCILVTPWYRTDYRVACSRATVFGAVTDPRNLVLIEGERNFLLTPENPDEFIAAVKDSIGKTDR